MNKKGYGSGELGEFIASLLMIAAGVVIVVIFGAHDSGHAELKTSKFVLENKYLRATNQFLLDPVDNPQVPNFVTNTGQLIGVIPYLENRDDFLPIIKRSADSFLSIKDDPNYKVRLTFNELDERDRLNEVEVEFDNCRECSDDWDVMVKTSLPDMNGNLVNLEIMRFNKINIVRRN